MTSFRKGQAVTWRWGSSTAEGTIAEIFTEKVTKTIKGRRVTRNASREEPAYLVTQKDGGRALKSASELNERR